MKNARIAPLAALPLVALAVVVVARPAGAQDAPLPPGGSYHALTPARILDTRSGLGGASGPTQSVTVGTAGVATIPSSGVAAVAINVTVTAPTGNGFVTAYPAGVSRPNASIANYAKGQTVAAMTIVGVDPAGEFTIYSAASAQLIADVVGYFTTAPTATTAGLYNSLTPARTVDTRRALGGTAPGPAGITTVQVTGVGGVPASGVSAVVINTTVTAPTTGGYVTAYPAGIARPNVSAINFARGETRTNRAIVPLGKDGKISFYNAAGTTQLVIDVDGYFGDDAGSYYVPTTPSRMVDGRTSCGAAWHDPGTTSPLGVTVDAGSAVCGDGRAPSRWSVAPSRAVWLTLTAVQATSIGFVVAYPAGVAEPATSDLNPVVSGTVANSGPVGVGTGGTIQIYSSAGFRNTGSTLLVDISGYFQDAPQAPTPQGIWAWAVPTVDYAYQDSATQDVRAVAGSTSLTTALLGNGTLVGFSLPSFGGGHLVRHDPPASVTGVRDVVQLIGVDTTWALRADGTVVAWGQDSHGEFGDGSPTELTFIAWGANTVTPQTGTVAIDDVATIGAAMKIGYAVKTDGTVWAWGRNDRGQLGNGTQTDSYTPAQVTGLTGARSIAGGASLSYAVDADGRLWRWGGWGAADLVPKPLDGGCAVGVSVFANTSGAWELCDDGTVYQLDHTGWPIYGGVSYPRQVPSLAHITALASGPGGVAAGGGVQALDTDGRVWRYDQATSSFLPVYGLSGVTAIGSGAGIPYAAVR